MWPSHPRDEKRNIQKLQTQGEITIHPELNVLLKAEAIKNRFNKNCNSSTLLNKQLKTAAKQLHDHPDIFIKVADKTNIFVVINKTDYNSKLQTLLDNHTKFKRIYKNPINQLKTKINKLITANNA